MLRGVLGFVYLVIGLIVASNHNYLHFLTHIKWLASAVLAILAWPLVVLGVSLHIH